MKTFFSGALASYSSVLEKNNIKRILISIYGIKDLFQKIKNQSWMIKGDVELIIDNGAFSAWNSGKKIISVEEYSDFCNKFHKEFSSLFKEIYYIGLDHIPGTRNGIPTKEEAKEACEITYKNYLHMLNNNCVNVLPVIHQEEDLFWVSKYEEYTDYICVGGIKKNKSLWFDNIFDIIKTETKLHGLAVTGKRMHEKYPWYSADSTSWLKPFMYGWVYDWDFYTLTADRFQELDTSKILTLKQYEIFLSYFDEKLTQSEKAEYHIDYHINQYLLLEKYITQLWKERGIIYE